MKRTLLFLLMLVSLSASAQLIQKNTTYGIAFNRTGADTLLYLPSDTFTVPTAYRNYNFIARKATTLYLWNTSTYRWAAVSTGGSGGGIGATTDSVINIRSYSPYADGTTDDSVAIKAAIATGKTVYFPKGNYFTNAVIILNNSGQRIYGDGIASKIVTTKTNSPIFKTTASKVTIEGLYFVGSQTQSTGGVTVPSRLDTARQMGIWFRTASNTVKDCHFFKFGGRAVYITDGVNVTPQYYNNVINCRFDSVVTAVETDFQGEYCYFSGNTITNSYFGFRESSAGNQKYIGNTIIYSSRAMYLQGTDNGLHGSIIGNELNHNGSGLEIEKGSQGELISGNTFFYSTIDLGTVDTVSNLAFYNNVIALTTINATRVKESKMSGGYFLPTVTQNGSGLDYLDIIGNNTTNKHFYTPSTGFVINSSAAVGNTSGADASALLEVKSTTKGFLLPRMTGSQQNAISSPATGLLIWNTDSSALTNYTGSAWLKVSQEGSGSSGLTIGTTTITGSVTRSILYDSSGILRRNDSLLWTGGVTGVLQSKNNIAAITNSSNSNVGKVGSYQSGLGAGVELWYQEGNGNSWLRTVGGIRLDLDAPNSTILSRRKFWIGGGTDYGANVGLEVWKSSTGTADIQQWLSSGGTVLSHVDQNGSFAIGTSSAPAASAVVDIVSTTKGFLPPRMTATQASAISSPAEGLLVYVTNTNGTFTAKGWWGYDGSAWVKLN